jgi:hypothetical protein
LKIASDSARFWVEFPRAEGFNLKDIYPKDAETIIRQALRAGWKPSEKGAPLKLEFKDEKLSLRLKED